MSLLDDPKIRQFADTIPALVFMTDAQGQNVYTNRRYQTFTGRPAEDLLGEGWLETLHPDDVPRVRQVWADATAAQRAYEAEGRLRRHDGAYRWFAARVELMTGAPGEPTGWVGTCVEIEEERRHEASLAASEGRLATAVDIAALGVWEFDPMTLLTRGDERFCEMYGLAPGEALSLESLFELIHPDDRETAERTVLAFLAAGDDGYRLEYRLQRPDGSYRWLVVRGRALGLGADNGYGFERIVGTSADITQQKLAEEALRSADRAKQDFLAVLGHELRNPLAPIRSGVDLLSQHPSDPSLVARVLPMLDRQLSHLVRLVDDLLDTSRIQQGTIWLQQADLDLRTSLDAAIEQTQPLVEERRHELRLRGTDAPLLVNGDGERLTQVFANLIGNAAKYMEPGGIIHIDAARADDEAVVRVRDAGRGISAEALGDLFELFSRNLDRQEDSPDGLGIGLALARRIVELHGGIIEARSDGVGRGAEFTVRVPLTGPGCSQPEPAPATVSGPVSLRRVLVVDDNVDAAIALQMMLEALGHRADTAHDGPAALRRIDEFRPEVVLLDLGMPGMDGLEVARRARGLPGGDGLRLVAVTGWGQERDKQRSREAGFDRHLTKPVDLDDLQRVLADVCG